jgi:hypothetical protein
VFETREGKEAAFWTLVLAVAAVGILCGAPAIARTAVIVWLVAVSSLWWLTSGAKPWVWRYSGRASAPRLARLGYCILQINRTTGRLMMGALQLTVVVLVLAMLATALVALFDGGTDLNLSDDAYRNFFRHDLPEWLAQSAGGHAGTD